MKLDLTLYKTLILFIVFFIGQGKGFSEKYVIKNFTPQEYKAGIQNIDFAQNRDMTIYVANNLGVLSFNGTNWDRYDTNTGKKKRSLAFDETTNRLYVGSQGEFGYYVNEWEYVSLVNMIPEKDVDFDEVWDVYIINSHVYFCTFSAIFIYNGREIKTITHPDGLDRCFETNGVIYVQSQLGQLYYLEHDQLVEVELYNPDNQIIAGVVPIENGSLVIFNSGLVELVSSYNMIPQFEPLIQALKGTYVNHVLQISDARMVISTQTSGLFLYDIQHNTIESITVEEGLSSNACLRSFQDYAGNLWVGMQNGIALVYSNSPLRLINEEINLQGSGYDAISTIDGTYYSTSNGIYYLPENSVDASFIPGTEGPSYSFSSIGGRLYAGHHTGLFELNQGQATKIVTTEGFWDVKQLQSKPNYYLGGMYSGLYLFRLGQDGHLEPIQPVNGFDESSRFFEEDTNGKIWVGQYYKGLYKLTFSEDLLYATSEKIDSKNNISLNDQIILGKIDNDLYVGTPRGIFMIDIETNGIVQSNPFNNVIGGQQVYLFQQDNQKNIHVITENVTGYFKHVSSKNYQFVPSSLYQIRYYLNNDLLSMSHNKENILFSANEGFISYLPSSEYFNNYDKPVVISKVFSVTRDSAFYSRQPFYPRPVSINELVIDFKDKVLQIEVESFEFKNLNNHLFRFFLKGFDNEFTEWSENNLKEYTNLTEGEYELVVQAKSYLGNVHSSQPVKIHVNPPFYRSMVAKVLYVLLGLSSLIIVSRLQKRRYTIKAIRLEEEKNRKVAEEKLKFLEIKRQKEKELMQLKDEKLENEIEHVNSLLAASTMNLVVKNEFIEMIRSQLDDLKRKGGSSETKQALEHITREIETTLRLKEDWEQFEHHFDKVHGDFLSRLREEYLDLTPNEQKLCTFLRLNLSTKEIANSMSISLRGVEVARYRLRKKLGLEKGENLSKFILEY